MPYHQDKIISSTGCAHRGAMSEKFSSKEKLLKCEEWLQNQSQQPMKLLQQNKNDIQFIIQTNADRKKFLISAAEDVATVPAGVNESTVEPQAVPVRRLRKDKLNMECDWQNCDSRFGDYEKFQKHVRDHISQLHIMEHNGINEYVCLWDVCGHKTSDREEIVRHVNYHAYHARLMAIGYNARATMMLAACNKDSTKRNHLPPLKSDHVCLWTGCNEKFYAIQMLFDHVTQHIVYSDKLLCSWAGCGSTFTRRSLLTMHARSHTGERLIACYHCGQHFATNSKLNNHLQRQNVDPRSEYSCNICGAACASAYLAREHSRQHVSQHACTLCDMSAPSLAALAVHVRYRHLPADTTRVHACPTCPYKAITKSDLRRHIARHARLSKKENIDSDKDYSDDEEMSIKKEEKPKKKYACHMCPKNDPKVFSRGTRLTKHLVKVHEAQWPFGYSRFRYQISDDGMYRLTTTRYEILEVSEKIVDGYQGPKDSLSNTLDFNLEQKAEPTLATPNTFEISIKEEFESEVEKSEVLSKKDSVEITMCDVDEHGNIISSEVIISDLVRNVKQE